MPQVTGLQLCSTWVSGHSTEGGTGLPGLDARTSSDCPPEDPTAQGTAQLFQTRLGFLFDVKVSAGWRATYAADEGCRLPIGGLGGDSAGL